MSTLLSQWRKGIGKEGKRIKPGGGRGHGEGKVNWGRVPGASGNSSALSRQQALVYSISSPLSPMLSRTKLTYPKDLYTSRFQVETNTKILIGVMTILNVIFYEMFGKTQKGIIVCHMKFKRWLHPFVWRFSKVLFYKNRNGVRKYQLKNQPLTC